jgi:hypothetical protein
VTDKRKSVAALPQEFLQINVRAQPTRFANNSAGHERLLLERIKFTHSFDHGSCLEAATKESRAKQTKISSTRDAAAGAGLRPSWLMNACARRKSRHPHHHH